MRSMGNAESDVTESDVIFMENAECCAILLLF